jgi:hypothetical protein
MFKNVSRLIPSSVFTSPNHYILGHANQTLEPSSQFFNPDKPKQNYTPFESAILSLAFS